jgi:cyclopropane fatty-acyl-phospholipid synthase-like methyltransferase
MEDHAYGMGLSNDWADEKRRLASVQEVYDPATFRHLDALGISSGMHCLEVGGGGGSVAVFMSERVGPTGSSATLRSISSSAGIYLDIWRIPDSTK